MLTPSQLIFLTPANGAGNIAYQIGYADRWVLAFLRVHFRRISGSGTEVANMTFDIDSDLGTDWDVRLKTLTSVGVSFDVNLRIGELEYADWTFEPRHKLFVNWTNPETTGEIQWGLEAAIHPAW